jgi:hypothetical protein
MNKGKAIIFLLFLLFPVILFSQTSSPITEPAQNPIAAYRLFRTSNIWTFIKLDTQDGRMWQVQFDVQNDNRMTVFLNAVPLVELEDKLPGRFTLYPTTNVFTFILLDQINGRTWQVQWSQKASERGVIPIN